MPYVYRRKPQVVDLLIEDLFRVLVTIRDGVGGEAGDSYSIQINESLFTVEDTTPSTSDSSTIATNLASEINSGPEPVTASASGAVVEVRADDRTAKFSYEVSTTDSDGYISAAERTADSYKIQNAANWDGTFTTMETVPAVGGKRSPSLRGPANQTKHAVNANALRGKVRFLFDPGDYSLSDTDVIFYRVVPVVNGVDLSPSSIRILPTVLQMTENHGTLLLKGDVPQAADMDSAVEIIFPRQISSLTLESLGAGGDTLFYSFGDGSAHTLQDGQTFRDNRLNITRIRMRADSAGTGPVPVELYVTINQHKML